MDGEEIPKLSRWDSKPVRYGLEGTSAGDVVNTLVIQGYAMNSRKSLGFGLGWLVTTDSVAGIATDALQGRRRGGGGKKPKIGN